VTFSALAEQLEQCVSQKQIVASILDIPGFKDQLLTLINNYRSGNGLSTLARVQGLEAVAQSHSDAMSACNNLTHVDPCSNSASAACQTQCMASTDPHCLDNCAVNERITAAGYSASLTGENLATGLTPEAVFDGWVASTEHRAVLLTPGFTQIGLGLAVSCTRSGGVAFWWTADFGTNGDSTSVPPSPKINAQAEAAQLVGYLQAADAAYCAGNLTAFEADYKAFVDQWVAFGLLSDCTLTLNVYNCITSVIGSLTVGSVTTTSPCPSNNLSYIQCTWHPSFGT
jgi:uncharacterized protein YkwD